jgi:chromosome partitioning protein
MTAKILTISIQKGGIGKTTTAAALAQAAAARGLKVLAIDLDPQGNLTFALDGTAGSGGSYAFLSGSTAAEAMQRTPQGIDLLAASPDLAALYSFKGSARRLQTELEPVKDIYQAIIIDAPTMPGELLFNALQASTALVIPIEADVYNVQSLYQTIDTARQIMQSNPALNIAGIVFTKYDGRANLSRQMRDTVTAKAAEMGAPYLGTIRAGIAVREAAALQRSLFEYAPRSNPAADYMALFDTIFHEV